MIVLETFDAVRAAATGTVGLVPTMGYLHEGHLSLVRRAVEDAETCVASVFVNPTQFESAEDIETYPRDIERDAMYAADAGCHILFAPRVDEMYPDGSSTTVSVGGVTNEMEGHHRPDHFDGVATVVTKLFAGIHPDFAYFGRKDAQQLAVVESLARDLSFPTRIVGMPVVRETDGLALSSRNVRLVGEDRARAAAISAALMDAADAYDQGDRDLDAIKARVGDAISAYGIDVEYVELADAATARVATEFAGDQFLAVAAKVGAVRLIDNVWIDGEAKRVDRGTRLGEPSILYGGD